MKCFLDVCGRDWAAASSILKCTHRFPQCSVQEVKIIKMCFVTIDCRSYKANLASFSSHIVSLKVGQEETPDGALKLPHSAMFLQPCGKVTVNEVFSDVVPVILLFCKSTKQTFWLIHNLSCFYSRLFLNSWTILSSCGLWRRIFCKTSIKFSDEPSCISLFSEFLFVFVTNTSAIMYIFASYVMPCGLAKLYRHFKEAHYVASSEMSVHFYQTTRQLLSKVIPIWTQTIQYWIGLYIQMYMQ
jgi:hypothetical protein